MPRSKRIPKTLNRRLLDLDDHLFLLEEALNRLTDGEAAYIKSLAAELRVLICLSSDTEGLLWRLAEELNVSDLVHVHLPGNLNRDHPLARKLHFAFVPIARAGQGDPRLPAALCSLKGIIKDCEAVYISGKGIMHEQLIKAVAQQIGSAHEDEGIDPHLAELSDIFFSNKQPFIQVLASDASLALEVGESVLQKATQLLAFQRKTRRRVILQGPTSESTTTQQIHQFEHEALPELPKEGTVFFGIGHPHPDWITNQGTYSFGPFKKGLLTVAPTKHPDGTLEIVVEGLLEKPVVSRQLIPESDQPGVSVAMTWKKDEIVIYINGRPVETVTT